MKIENYRFGSITVNGEIYKKDVIIFPDRVLSPWWRETGHNLSIKDLKEVLDFNPDIILIGTGAYGVMNVPEETVNKIEHNEIEVIILKTADAVGYYNEKIKKGKKLVACLHLTC